MSCDGFQRERGLEPWHSWLLYLSFALGLMCGFQCAAQDFYLLETQFQDDGSGRLVYPSEPQSYYLLESSSDLTSFATPVDLALGQADTGEFSIPAAPGTLTRFYRIRRLSNVQPLDSDQDGLDDVYELQHPANLNPLSAADALLDPDGDGVSTREERLRGTDPFVSNLMTQIAAISPAHGEGGVSVTRETILRFTQPLAADAQLNVNNLYASFGGRKLLARTELASDRRTVTLFYLEQLPASARIRVTFNGAGVNGTNGLSVDADGDGQPGGVAMVDFDTLGITPVLGTAVIGHVYASEKNPDGSNRPLAGVTITVDGAEETLRTTTRSDGSFTLSNSPSGRFFVHVDGRTAEGSAWPAGAYYPFVGKAWEARPGVATNLANTTGDIFLPLVPQGSLQPVSATADTVVTFPPEVVAANPALAGVAVMIPANSLYSDNGTRGGRVGIAPVPPDRLPEPLPSGLSFPLVITIQTDGPSNFDRPVPVRFPNLPDPVTGVKLPPGAKSALWSFNHDTGRWEIQGPMTVTADGNYVESDAGVGVRQPGWHGVRPGGDNEGCKKDCCQQKPWKIVETVWDALKAAKDLIADLAGLKQLVRCAITLATTTDDLLRSVVTTSEQLKNSSTFSKAQLIGILESLNGERSRIASILSDCKEATPGAVVKKGRKIWDGLNGIVQTANKLCKPINDPPPSCKPGTFLKTVCENVGPVASYAQEADAIIKGVEVYLDNATTEVVLFALDGVIKAVIELIKTSDLPPGTVHRAKVNDDFKTSIEDLITVLEAVKETGDLTARLLVSTDTGLVQFKSWEDEARLASEVPHPLAEEGVAWAFSTQDDVLRGRASDYGAIFAILPPAVPVTLAVYYTASGAFGRVDFVSAPNGQTLNIPDPEIFDPRTLADSDHDGLANEVEMVLGTAPSRSDTDGDGVPDGVEIQQGTDPLDGLPVATGIIASAPTSGPAVDVAAANDIAVTANGTAGINVFNVANAFNPLRVAQVDTPGNAVRVAFSGSFVAVADDTAGLAIIDVSDPPAARILHQVALGGSATSVAVAGGVAYVGLDSGAVISVDLTTGTVLEQVNLGTAVRDFGLSGNTLCVLTASSLHTLSLADGLTPLGSLAVSTVQTRRMAVGGGLAYVAESFGVTAIDVTNPASPVIAMEKGFREFGWLQFVPNGSGLGIGPFVFVGAENQIDLSLYDLRDPTSPPRFVTILPTPGYTVSLAIYNGLAYVADYESGLQVFNYQSFDTQRKPPTLTLRPSFTLTTATNGIADEGQALWVEALTTDDVQVRNVEFYLDGEKVFTDGGFPFEGRFVAPAITATRTNFTVRAKATDTGGNFTWSDEVLVELGHDTTPPSVRRTLPADGGVGRATDGVVVFFSEPLSAGAFDGTSVTLTFAGEDHIFGTTDDIPVMSGLFEYREYLNAGVIRFPDGLAQGFYRVRIAPTLSDVAGNRIATVAESTFWVLADGADGDSDGDGVLNANETALKLNPLQGDSDSDGWDDGVELADQTDPLNPTSRPRLFAFAHPRIAVDIPEPAEPLDPSLGTFFATPDITVAIPEPAEAPSSGTFWAIPAVTVAIPEPAEELDSSLGTFVAVPGIAAAVPERVEMPDLSLGTYRAYPTVSVAIPEAAEVMDPASWTLLAWPPVSVEFTPPSNPTAIPKRSGRPEPEPRSAGLESKEAPPLSLPRELPLGRRQL